MRNKRKRGLHKTAATDGIMKGKLYHRLETSFPSTTRVSFLELRKRRKKKERNIEYRLKIFNDRTQPLNASISIKGGCFELSWNDNFQLYAEGKKKEAKIE